MAQILWPNAVNLDQFGTSSDDTPREKAGVDTVSHHHRYQRVRPDVEGIREALGQI